MHDGMPYGRNQGQGQGHSREVDHQSPTGLIFYFWVRFCSLLGKIWVRFVILGSDTQRQVWLIPVEDDVCGCAGKTEIPLEHVNK